MFALSTFSIVVVVVAFNGGLFLSLGLFLHEQRRAATNQRERAGHDLLDMS